MYCRPRLVWLNSITYAKFYLHKGGRGLHPFLIDLIQRWLHWILQLHKWQQHRPISVPWEYCVGQVQCNDGRIVVIDPAEQSRTNMLQRNELKIYLTTRNLGRAHMLPRGARALQPQKETTKRGQRG